MKNWQSVSVEAENKREKKEQLMVHERIVCGVRKNTKKKKKEKNTVF